MSAVPAVALLPVIKEFITTTGSYLECREQEKTKREQIAAELEAKLTIINKQYDLCKEVMANNHEYAMKAYDAVERLMKEPSVVSNPTLLQMVLTFFQTVHKDNINGMLGALPTNRLGV